MSETTRTHTPGKQLDCDILISPLMKYVLIKREYNCYEKVLILSKADLFQVVIHEVHNQLPTEFSALCYKK